MKRPLVFALMAMEVIAFVLLIWIFIPSSMTIDRAIRDLQDREDSPRRKLVRAINQIPFVDLPMDSLAEVQAAAVEFLGRQGPDASRAAPLLVKRLADVDLRVVAAARLALLHIGKSTIPALQNGLESSDPRVRRVAFAILLDFGVYDDLTIRRAREFITQDDGFLRRRVFHWAIKREAIVRDLKHEFLTALNDKDHVVKIVAAIGLVRIGTDLEVVLPNLLIGKYYLGSGVFYYSPEVMDLLANCLEGLEPSHESMNAALKALLKDKDPGVVLDAAAALWRRSRDKDAVLPVVLALAFSRDPRAEIAITILSQMNSTTGVIATELDSIAANSTHPSAKRAGEISRRLQDRSNVTHYIGVLE